MTSQRFDGAWYGPSGVVPAVGADAGVPPASVVSPSAVQPVKASAAKVAEAAMTSACRIV
ncbi:hypothetical protein ACGFI9_04360 [Micromonospora sp. NPDC048930]|uniref:hypothetical protein n=1 Tax=Micromonospora sp. NPDC048930 TaxID=3364261 RepID=UPI003715D3EC